MLKTASRRTILGEWFVIGHDPASEDQPLARAGDAEDGGEVVLELEDGVGEGDVDRVGLALEGADVEGDGARRRGVRHQDVAVVGLKFVNNRVWVCLLGTKGVQGMGWMSLQGGEERGGGRRGGGEEIEQKEGGKEGENVVAVREEEEKGVKEGKRKEEKEGANECQGATKGREQRNQR